MSFLAHIGFLAEGPQHGAGQHDAPRSCCVFMQGVTDSQAEVVSGPRTSLLSA